MLIGKPAEHQTIGLLGGSFNPVHTGHMMIASYLTQWGYLDQVWLNLTPRNPIKKDPSSLLPDTRRLTMLSIALKNTKHIDICDIELSMPRPLYTINTLRLLASKYPELSFKLIIGADNWQIFDQWHESQQILDEFGVIVYPRTGYPVPDRHVDGMEFVDAPTVNISSTFIRNAIARGKNMEFFLPAGVNKYIIEHKLYRNDK